MAARGSNQPNRFAQTTERTAAMTSKDLFDATARIQIERWTTEVAARAAEGFIETAAEIRGWIAQLQPLISTRSGQ